MFMSVPLRLRLPVSVVCICARGLRPVVCVWLIPPGAPVARAVVCVRGWCVPLGVRSCTRLFGSSHGYNHYNHHVQMRRHFAAFALRASARAGALDAIVNAAVDIIHTMSTATLVVLHAVLVVSAVGVAWALRPQNTHDSAFGPAKSQAKMQPRDLPARATTLCKTNKTHKRRKKSSAASMALTGGLLGTLVLAAQVGPARAYSCTSDAGCAYEGCNDRSCACSSSLSTCVNGFWTGYSTCNNGVWDAICVSTTHVTTTKQAETLCTVVPLCIRILHTTLRYVLMHFGVNVWHVRGCFMNVFWMDE